MESNQQSSDWGKVLLADDDSDYRESLAERLRRTGFQVACAPSGTAALTELRARPVEVLLADINMPGNQQLELLTALRAEQPDLPIVLLTGRPTMETAVTSANHPSVVGYLIKPPAQTELLCLLGQSINRYRCCQRVRQSQREWDRWMRELSQVEQNLQKNLTDNRTPFPTQHLLLLLNNLSLQLTELKESLDLVPQAALPEAAVPDQALLEVIARAITVLRASKQNFKSKRLHQLRLELEAVLDHQPG